jgi:hypothetical protein
VLERYVISPSAAYTFSEQEIDDLTRDIGSGPVFVQVGELHGDLLLLTELGHRHIDVRWARDDWQNYVLRYRTWPWPVVRPGKVSIRLTKEPTSTHHFDLVHLND